MTAPPDPAAIKARLLARADELLARLLPGGRMHHREYRAKGPNGDTWAVELGDRKAGHWISGASDLRGTSLLSLIRDIACSGDHIKAWSYALRFLGDDAYLPAARPAAHATRQQPQAPGDNGKHIYLHANEFAWSNPVGLYLQARGLDPADFERPIGALRHHPTLWNGELHERIDAMVAPIMNPNDSTFQGIHRTYLQRPGNTWRKANVNAPKMVKGRLGGGLIPLTRGASRKRFSKAPDGDKLLLSEGIENALAVAGDEPDWRACAYVAANNLLQLRLPACFADVCLVIDRDGENWSVTEDRELALEQWRIEGRRVHVWQAPPGIKDAADYINQTEDAI